MIAGFLRIITILAAVQQFIIMRLQLTVALILIFSILKAQTPELVRDFVSFDPGIDSDEIVEFKGKVYFNGYSESTGTELWVSEGSVETTNVLFDFAPGNNSSFPRNLVTTNDHLFFRTDEPGTDRQVLYAFDGVDTLRVLDADEIFDLRKVGEHVIINSREKLKTWMISISDGTSEGLDTLKIGPEMVTIAASSAAINSKGEIYFSQYSQTGFDSIFYITPEMTLETVTGSDILFGGRYFFTSLSGRVFLQNALSSEINELKQGQLNLIFNGAGVLASGDQTFGIRIIPGLNECENESLEIIDLNTSGEPSLGVIPQNDIMQIAVVNEKIVLAANTIEKKAAYEGSNLWSIDTSTNELFRLGTSDGEEIKFADQFNVIGDKLYFTARTKGLEQCLWRTNGTKAETMPIAHATDHTYYTDLKILSTNDEFLVAAMHTDTHGPEIWSLEADSDEFKLHGDINPGPEGCIPGGLWYANETRGVVTDGNYYSTDILKGGALQLWVLDLREGASQKLTNSLKNYSDESTVTFLSDQPGEIVFLAGSNNNVKERKAYLMMQNSDPVDIPLGRMTFTENVAPSFVRINENFGYFFSNNLIYRYNFVNNDVDTLHLPLGTSGAVIGSNQTDLYVIPTTYIRDCYRYCLRFKPSATIPDTFELSEFINNPSRLLPNGDEMMLVHDGIISSSNQDRMTIDVVVVGNVVDNLSYVNEYNQTLFYVSNNVLMAKEPSTAFNYRDTIETGTRLEKFVIKNNFIGFRSLDDGNLYLLNPNTYEVIPTQLSYPIEGAFTIMGNYCYVVGNDNIVWRFNMNTKESEAITSLSSTFSDVIRTQDFACFVSNDDVVFCSDNLDTRHTIDLNDYAIKTNNFSMWRALGNTVYVTADSEFFGANELWRIKLDESTSVESLSESLSLQAFPNPSSGVFNIKPQRSTDHFSGAMVFDISGKVVPHTLEIEEGLIKLTLDNVPDGMYIAVIEIAETTYQSILILQR